MNRKTYILKGKRMKQIPNELAIELMARYTVAHTFVNQFGNVFWIRSKRGNRLHSILIGDYQ